MPSHRRLPRNEVELVKALRAIEMAQARVLAHEMLAKREANVWKLDHTRTEAEEWENEHARALAAELGLPTEGDDRDA